MFKWENVKERIHSNTKKAFLNGTPLISDDILLEGIDLFKKVILYKVGSTHLDGLPQVIIPALDDALISKVGDIGSLRIIADSLEPYLKKLSIIGIHSSINEVQNLTLIPILKKLNVNSELSSQLKATDYPELSEPNLDSFRTKNQYLYEICNSFIIRNKVHQSPDLSQFEVLTFLIDLLIVFIYSTLQFKNQITALPEIIIRSKISDQVLNGDENKMLFDFISFGNTTTEIKTQIIDAYILHYLIDKESDNLVNIKKSADSYLNSILSEQFYKRKIEELKQKGKVTYQNSTMNSIQLSSRERERLNKVLIDFQENKDLFILYYTDIIDKYGLNDNFDTILDFLKDFFVANFNIDIKEIYEHDIVKNENTILEDFIAYLQPITKDEVISKKLLIDLLKLCEESDFIVRLSASKIIGKLTNPEYFQNYVRKQKRIVYVDTQLVLHALCTGYISKIKYENIYFQIIEELLIFTNEHPNIELRFSRLYLSEVAHQLKLALLLIPFEDFAPSHFSTNVFYQFYDYLKENNLLRDSDDSFASFLNNWLVVDEEDALRSDCDQIISSNISDLLNDQLQVKIISLPFYENRDSAIYVLDETIKQHSLSFKSHHNLTNDALMVCHLSNSEEHSSEPFFLTWDKTFLHYRKSFKEKFHRMDIISWHLFNPSKFINHMALLEFRIDPKSITNEYLSILDSFGLQEKTRTIYDNMNRLIDIKNISKIQRRKYVEIINNIFNTKEFSDEFNLQEDDGKDRVSKTFETIINEINSYYHDPNGKYKIDFYRKMMLIEDYFIKVVDIIIKEIREENGDSIERINSLLKEYEESIKIQHNIPL